MSRTRRARLDPRALAAAATAPAAAVARVGRAAGALPGLTFAAWRHGVLPAGYAAACTARREGTAELHWKVVGDGLVRFLRNAGPVFTKFGQVLATRSDLLPAAVCARLESLYAEQPPMPRRALERALRAAYGRALPFADFEWRPIAVGSIGQVHRARLADGERVIVKLLRPAVERRIARDLDVARTLLPWLLGLRGGRATRRLIARCLDDLAAAYAREVDLGIEAEALREFAARFANSDRVRVPACRGELSGPRVLVMEELDGVPLSRFRERAGSDPEAAQRVADLAFKEILKQVFEDGRFHADPHPGNLLVLADGRLGLVDLGLTGELGAEDRRRIARAVRAFLARDARAVFEALLGFGVVPDDFDREGFEREISEVVGRRAGGLARRLRGKAPQRAEATGNALEQFVGELFTVSHRYGVHVPSSATLLIKTLVTIEGVARSLHPELDLATAAAPVLLRSLAPRWVRWMLPSRP